MNHERVGDWCKAPLRSLGPPLVWWSCPVKPCAPIKGIGGWNIMDPSFGNTFTAQKKIERFQPSLLNTVPFRSIRQSRVTAPSVLSKIGPCHASPRPVSNRSNMWQGRKGPKFRYSAQISAVSAGICVFCLSRPLAAPIHHKMHQKLPVQALLSVENFTWSRSLAVCVEVSNWSNVSQSQVRVELIEMVQYLYLQVEPSEICCSRFESSGK